MTESQQIPDANNSRSQAHKGWVNPMIPGRERIRAVRGQCAAEILRIVARAMDHPDRNEDPLTGGVDVTGGEPQLARAESARIVIRAAVLEQLQWMKRCYGLTQTGHSVDGAPLLPGPMTGSSVGEGYGDHPSTQSDQV